MTVTWSKSRQYSAQPMVKWHSVRELIGGQRGEFLGGLFGAYSDTRELLAAQREGVLYSATPSASPLKLDPLSWQEPELRDSESAMWVDYVADVGDGFSPTYTIAEAIAAGSQTVDGVTCKGCGLPKLLNRGELLVFGGDQVYPVATSQAYKERTVGPYRTAYQLARADPPSVFAIPGNHDWYDGLNGFRQEFTAREPGGEIPDPHEWDKRQTRSYFAIELTNDWWLWGIDVALDAYIDDAQIEYFVDAGKALTENAKIILCSANPAWLDRGAPSRFANAASTLLDKARGATLSKKDRWDHLRYFVNKTIPALEGERSMDRVKLVISGDKHFYTRHNPTECGDGPTMVTAGGGGAYLSSTADAPKRLDVPLEWDTEDVTPFELATAWPTQQQAKLTIGLSALWKVPMLSLGLAPVLGVLYLLFGAAVRSQSDNVAELSTVGVAGGAADAFSTAWSGFAGVVLMASLAVLLLFAARFEKANPVAQWLAALSHIALHLAGMSLVASLAANVAFANEADGFRVLTALAISVAVVLLLKSMIERYTHSESEWLATLLTLAGAGLFSVVTLISPELGELRPQLTYFVGLFMFGSAIGLLILAVYLAFAQLIGVNSNFCYTGIRHAGYKHFLRMRIDKDGIDVYCLGFTKMPARRLSWTNDGLPEVSCSEEPLICVDKFSIPAAAR